MAAEQAAAKPINSNMCTSSPLTTSERRAKFPCTNCCSGADFFPVAQVVQQVIYGEIVLGALTVALEHDLGPATHADRREPMTEQPEFLPGNGPNQHAFVTGALQLIGRKEVIPVEKTPNFFVFRGHILVLWM